MKSYALFCWPIATVAVVAGLGVGAALAQMMLKPQVANLIRRWQTEWANFVFTSVAQTIPAYYKVVSDAIYGAGTRYVSRERLLAMLDYEYKVLLQRRNESRGSNTCFFVFADTIAARNYAGTNEQHGWLGVRFQFQPQSEPSQILLPINLCDPTAQLQPTRRWCSRRKPHLRLVSSKVGCRHLPAGAVR